MDGGWALVLSAVVTTVGGVLVALIAQFRKENKEDHAVVAGMLSHIYKSVGRVETKVDKVENKLNDHIKEHNRS
jgi:DNA anti-recombination protein RmuC